MSWENCVALSFAGTLSATKTLLLFPLCFAEGLLFLGLKNLAQMTAHRTAKGSLLIQTRYGLENLPKCPHEHCEGVEGSRYDSLYVRVP